MASTTTGRFGILEEEEEEEEEEERAWGESSWREAGKRKGI